jgi:spore coat protein CotH
VGTVGLRFKGSYSLTSCFDATGRLICPKLSMKLKFSEYDPEKRFHGLKRLHLNSALGDKTLVHERLAYGLFRDMGIISPRTSYAVVTVNGNPQGLYIVVEDVDGRFTDDRFAEGNGNLYKEAWPQTEEVAYFDYHLETNQETASHGVFQAFARGMMTASDATLLDQLGQWTDVDYFTRYMAVDYAIANWDGITTFYCGSWGCGNHNYYMYQEESQPRFWIIPWDMNATFFLEHWLGAILPWDDLNADCSQLIPTADGQLTTRPAACDPVIRALALNRTPYRDKVQELLDRYFVVARLDAQIDQASALLRPLVAVDPFLPLAEWQGALAWARNQLPLLRTRLEKVVQ